MADYGQVSLWAVGGIAQIGVERWVFSEHEGKEVDDDQVGDEPQEGLPEERSAR
jgi:hypothetical protein